MWDVRVGKRSFLFSINMKLEYFFISRLSLASSLGIINQQSSLVMRICLFYALSTVIQGYKNTFYSMLNQNPSWSIRGIRNFMLRQHPPWNIRIFFWKSIKHFFRMNFFVLGAGNWCMLLQFSLLIEQFMTKFEVLFDT